MIKRTWDLNLRLDSRLSTPEHRRNLVRNSPISAVKKRDESVVRVPNPENGKISNGPGVKKKLRKSVKEIRKEIELKSMKPLTSYYKPRSQILQQMNNGERKPNNEKETSN